MSAPPAISSPLTTYLATDGNVWSINPADGRAYQLSGNEGGGGGASTPGIGTITNDAYYDREDFLDINIMGGDANERNLASNFTTTSGAIGCSHIPWQPGHLGIIQLRAGTASGQNAVIQRNFGYGTPTAIDLTKVNKLIYRCVIKVDTLFTQYGGGGEHSWGILSTSNPICGAQFSIAPGFTGTDSVVAGNNIVTGTYLDASVPTMTDISRPIFPIAPNTWYDAMLVWAPTVVKFYMRTWTLNGSAAWVLCGTHTTNIGMGTPVYIERSAKNYGDSVSRSLFIDLEETYIDVGATNRYLGTGLLNF